MDQLIELLGKEAYDNMINSLESTIRERFPEYPDRPDIDCNYVLTGTDYEFFDCDIQGKPCEVELEYEYEATFEPYCRHNGYPGPDVIDGGEIAECKITPLRFNVYE